MSARTHRQYSIYCDISTSSGKFVYPVSIVVDKIFKIFKNIILSSIWMTGPSHHYDIKFLVSNSCMEISKIYSGNLAQPFRKDLSPSCSSLFPCLSRQGGWCILTSWTISGWLPDRIDSRTEPSGRRGSLGICCSLWHCWRGSCWEPCTGIWETVKCTHIGSNKAKWTLTGTVQMKILPVEKKGQF